MKRFFSIAPFCLAYLSGCLISLPAAAASSVRTLAWDNSATTDSATDQNSAYLGIKISPTHWQAEHPFAMADETPAGTVSRSSVGFRVEYQDNSAWRYGFSPSLYQSQEGTINPNTPWGFGLQVDASQQVQPDLSLGVGAGVYRQLDQTRLIPYLLIDWRISEQWHLNNPDVSSPAGPAGLELSYSPLQRWQFAAGGAWKNERFRLNNGNTATRSNIAESSGVPLYLRFGYTMQPGWKIDLYAAGLFGGKLNVEDESGNALSSDHFNVDPSVGINFTGHF